MKPVINPEDRPTALVAAAVLNFLFGGLAVLGALGGGLSILAIPLLARVIPTLPGGPNVMQEMADLYGSIPGFLLYTAVSMVGSLVMGVLLIVAGFGLLSVRPRARRLCVIWCIYTIVMTTAGTVYTFVVVNPAVEKWTADFQQKMAAAIPGAGVGMFGMDPGMQRVMTLGAAALHITYAVMLLVLLFLPEVSAAFRRASQGPVS